MACLRESLVGALVGFSVGRPPGRFGTEMYVAAVLGIFISLSNPENHEITLSKLF